MISVLGLIINCASYNRVITIDPLVGNDAPACINGEEPCLTLAFAFQSDHRESSTQYVLNEGTHILNESTETFKNLTFISLVGERTKMTVYCTDSNTGLAFIIVKDLTMYNCSALRYSTSRDYHNTESSVSSGSVH